MSIWCISSSDAASPINFQAINGQIYGNCKPFVFKGVNWHGFETDLRVVDGLFNFTIDAFAQNISRLGFNVVRFPISLENVVVNMQIDWASYNKSKNPELGWWAPVISSEALQVVIKKLADYNILVVLAMTHLKNSDFHDLSKNVPDLWYEGDITPTFTASALNILSKRYCNNWNVIGIDLFPPGDSATWGTNDNSTDWGMASVMFANGVLGQCPRLLVFVQGVGDGNGDVGVDLSGALTSPIGQRLIQKQRLVFGVQAYGPGTYKSRPEFLVKEFPGNLNDLYRRLVTQIASSTKVPVVVTEWGAGVGVSSTDNGVVRESIWATAFSNFLQNQGLSSFYFGLSPGGKITVGGLYNDNTYKTLNPQKLALVGKFTGTTVESTARTFCTVPDPTSTKAPSPTVTPSAKPSFSLDFVSAGGKLYANGVPFVFAGVNWFGAETSVNAPHGFWAQPWSFFVNFVSNRGFNAVRIPLSVEGVWFNSPVEPASINRNLNPDLVNGTLLSVLDIIVNGFSEKQILVVLDMHRLAPSNSSSELWYSSTWTEEQLSQAWETLATRYCSFPNVVAADLFGEPHGAATWGNDDPITDWRMAAGRIGNRVLSKCPRWLIFVQGIAYNTDPGANVNPAIDYPVMLSDPSKLVYAPHLYGPGVSGLTDTWTAADFPLNLRSHFETWFGRVAQQTGNAVVAGEWGSSYLKTDEKLHTDAMVSYFLELNMGSFYWALSPSSRDPGGLLLVDFTTPEDAKLNMLQIVPRTFVADAISATGGAVATGTPIPVVAPVVTSTPAFSSFVTATPSATPTLTATQIIVPIFGDQKVASSGDSFPIIPIAVGGALVVAALLAILCIIYRKRILPCLGTAVNWATGITGNEGQKLDGQRHDDFFNNPEHAVTYDKSLKHDDPFYVSALAAAKGQNIHDKKSVAEMALAKSLRAQTTPRSGMSTPKLDRSATPTTAPNLGRSAAPSPAPSMDRAVSPARSIVVIPRSSAPSPAPSMLTPPANTLRSSEKSNSKEKKVLAKAKDVKKAPPAPIKASDDEDIMSSGRSIKSQDILVSVPKEWN